jgi:hypothetical protein
VAKKIRIEIKSIWGTVLFEHEAEGNTLAKTVREANLHGANLYGADLRGADLREADPYGADLHGANLRGANLSGSNLYGADLHGANLRGADLHGANLHGADLHGADLHGADLHGADLRGADLRGADLHGADLHGADLRGADLRGADLHGADLHGADLHGADHADYAIGMTRILPEWSIIGWKKCRDDRIVKLLIPIEAKRSHAFGRKCRAEYAEVLEITKGKRKVKTAVSTWDENFTYTVGTTVKPNKAWSEEWTDECASGIHFWITRVEAEAWQA